MRRARYALAATGAAVGVLLLGGCGDDTSAKPTMPSETPALWNPCDAIDSDLVQDAFGTVAKEEDGTPTQPECRFSPDEKTGAPVVQANYQQFSGGLEAAWDTMGQPKDADVRRPSIPQADDARLVISVVKKQLYVTGFVQNGPLIQTLNVVDPAPYDEDRDIAGTERILTAFSRHAENSLFAQESDN
ncbi:hypothetical protein [Nocardioides panacisoli]